MKLTITLIGLLTIGMTFAQSTTNLSGNNCGADLNDNGMFFNDFQNSFGGYEVPLGSGINAIYSGAFWFAGTDVNGQLKMAMGDDFWPGALTIGNADSPDPNFLTQSFWKVSAADIQNHIANYAQPGYSAPNDILNWPAHGDVSIGQDFLLAPFVDVDFDGVYNPQNGDYPCIKGDHAVYMILNDKDDVHPSGGEPIGLEIHYMVYLSTNDFLNDVTFIDMLYINRGTQTLYDFVHSFYLDPDLGNYSDDYVGCDSTRNLMYVYNGDNYDELSGGVLGYEQTPPSLGVVCLSESVSSIGTYSNGGTGNPTTLADYKNFMMGLNPGGTPWLDNLGNPTKYIYSGDPTTLSGWSEESVMNPPGDRRIVMSNEKDNTVLVPFEEQLVSYAVIFAQDSTRLASVSKLFSMTDSVQNFFNNLNQSCLVEGLSIAEVQPLQFNIYPNPSKGDIHISIGNVVTNGILSIRNIQGQLIHEQLVNSEDELKLSLETTGMYFVTIQSNEQILTKKVVIE